MEQRFSSLSGKFYQLLEYKNNFMKTKNKNIFARKSIISKFNTGLYKNVKNIIETARNYSYNTINSTMVQAYWNIGRKIVEEEQKGRKRAGYGDYLIIELSKRLTNDFGRGYNVANLKNMRQFFITFSTEFKNKKSYALRSQSENQQKSYALRSQSKTQISDDISKVNALRSQSAKDRKSHALYDQSDFIINNTLKPELTWTHYRLLMRVENKKARDFYINETIMENWTTRQLERQIQSFYFERLLTSQNKLRVKREAKRTGITLQNDDFIKNPYILEFLNLKSNKDFLEKDLETALIDKLQEFILELGKGFAFVERQQRITTEHDDFFIDLVFYNYLLKCFVLIDLKVGKLTHQDIAQMDMYVRMYEDMNKGKDDNPTIGLILCSEKSETIVKYSVLKGSKQLFASKYMLYLPTEKELKREIQKEINNFRKVKLLKDKN